jgi:hypothetical protein
MPCLLLDCEYCDVKSYKPLHLAGEHLKYVFFSQTAGELRIFVLREEKSPITNSSPYLGLE